MAGWIRVCAGPQPLRRELPGVSSRSAYRNCGTSPSEPDQMAIAAASGSPIFASSGACTRPPARAGRRPSPPRSSPSSGIKLSWRGTRPGGRDEFAARVVHRDRATSATTGQALRAARRPRTSRAQRGSSSLRTSSARSCRRGPIGRCARHGRRRARCARRRARVGATRRSWRPSSGLRSGDDAPSPGVEHPDGARGDGDAPARAEAFAQGERAPGSSARNAATISRACTRSFEVRTRTGALGGRWSVVSAEPRRLALCWR